MIFAVILALTVPASAADPLRISDLEKFCQDIVQMISNKARRESADVITNSMGKPDLSGTLANAFQVFEGKNFDFTKKVVDKDYNGAYVRSFTIHTSKAYPAESGYCFPLFPTSRPVGDRHRKPKAWSAILGGPGFDSSSAAFKSAARPTVAVT